MSHNLSTVRAADTNSVGRTPSVTSFATKDELMTTFTPNADGTATTIGKGVFGKDSSGNPLEWYILGKDSGVTGDNIAIFMTAPIATGKAFNSSTAIKEYQYEANTGRSRLLQKSTAYITQLYPPELQGSGGYCIILEIKYLIGSPLL